MPPTYCKPASWGRDLPIIAIRHSADSPIGETSIALAFVPLRPARGLVLQLFQTHVSDSSCGFSFAFLAKSEGRGLDFV
jgi:hypothetical protein